jgi:hypothetical protein
MSRSLFRPHPGFGFAAALAGPLAFLIALVPASDTYNALVAKSGC